MPIRMLIAILVGTVLAFGWGAVSWTSGMYDFAFKPLPDGAAVAAWVCTPCSRRALAAQGAPATFAAVQLA